MSFSFDKDQALLFLERVELKQKVIEISRKLRELSQPENNFNYLLSSIQSAVMSGSTETSDLTLYDISEIDLALLKNKLKSLGFVVNRLHWKLDSAKVDHYESMVVKVILEE